MATSTIDGTVEEAVLKRRRGKASFYERVTFRLDDGSPRTWAKAHVANEVAALLVPGTHGRFYTFTAIDHRGISGVRTDDGREAFGINRVNEYAGLGLFISMTLLTIINIAVLEKVSIISLVLAILGLPMFFLYRQNRVDAEKAFRADSGYRPAAPAALAG